ncbi:MAG TPA: hypothetical protein VJN95_08015, partial [Gemmatimonadales bacterium]|nr:hypothetical protein [Gemmatimonadales bacterium]
MTATAAPQRQIGKSVLAIFLGFVVVFVLSLGTDQVFHMLAVYPPWGEPIRDNGLNALALGYRCVIQVLGGWVMAKFAPSNPVGHALAGGILGLVLSTAGAVAMIPKDLGPAWYPIALAASSVPTSWLGGWLFERGQ